jgi:hypothetical protein
MLEVFKMAQDGGRRGLRRAVEAGIITEEQIEPLLDVLRPPLGDEAAS